MRPSRGALRLRHVGAVLATVALAALALTPAPTAGAAGDPVETWLNCSAAGNDFNLPINMSGTSIPPTVAPEAELEATILPEVVLTEAWIQGALITGYTVFETQITEVAITNIRVRVPVPDGADGALLEMNWAEGNQVVGEANPDFDPDLPPSEDNVPSFATGDFAFSPPSPATVGYTATGTSGSDIDFLLGANALRIDLLIGGALPLPITCGSVATEIADPDGDPDADPPETIPFTQVPFLTVPVAEPDPDQPALTISDVTGQVVTNAARAGNVVSFGGPNWDEGEAVTVELCDTAGESCTTDGLDSVSASVDGDGNLSGSATITSAAAQGPGVLEASQPMAGNDDTASLRILGTPTLTGPAAGEVGTAIEVTGTNWNPGSTTTQVGFLGAGDDAVGTKVQATISSTGALTAAITVPEGAAKVAAEETELGYPAGSLVASYEPFDAQAPAPPDPTDPDPEPGPGPSDPTFFVPEGSTTLGFTCTGADTLTQNLLEQLGDGSLEVEVRLRSSAFTSVGAGEQFEVGFRWAITLGEELVTSARELDPESPIVNLSNAELTSGVVAGATGPDVVGKPPAKSLTLPGSGTLTFNEGPFTGTFTRTGDIGDPISFAAKGISLTAEAAGIALNLGCEPDPDGQPITVVDQEGELPPPSDDEPTDPVVLPVTATPGSQDDAATADATAMATATAEAADRSSLPVTGLRESVPFLLAAVVLLDLGYLALSAARPPRRRLASH